MPTSSDPVDPANLATEQNTEQNTGDPETDYVPLLLRAILTNIDAGPLPETRDGDEHDEDTITSVTIDLDTLAGPARHQDHDQTQQAQDQQSQDQQQQRESTTRQSPNLISMLLDYMGSPHTRFLEQRGPMQGPTQGPTQDHLQQSRRPPIPFSLGGRSGFHRVVSLGGPASQRQQRGGLTGDYSVMTELLFTAPALDDYQFNSMLSDLMGNVEVGVSDIDRVSELITRPTEEVTCPICQDAVLGPARRTLCGHMFCDACITPWFSSSKKCPMCMCDVEERAAAVRAS
jgi:hypothetical protein